MRAPDHGAGARLGATRLVELVVEEEVRLVLGDPALVGVVDVVVAGAAELLGVGLVRHVDDGQRVLVVVKADLAALELDVRPAVRDALVVVGVAVLVDAADGT